MGQNDRHYCDFRREHGGGKPKNALAELEKVELGERDSLTGQPIPPYPKPQEPPSLKNAVIEKACRATITKAYDEVEDETYFYGKYITLTRNRRRGIILNPTLLEDGAYIALRMSLAGVLGCVKDGSRVSILFRDGTRLFTNTGNSVMVCDGKVSLYFGGVFRADDDLKMLMEKPIKTIRVYTYNSSIEEDFTVAQANSLIASLKCLYQLLVKK